MSEVFKPNPEVEKKDDNFSDQVDAMLQDFKRIEEQNVPKSPEVTADSNLVKMAIQKPQQQSWREVFAQAQKDHDPELMKQAHAMREARKNNSDQGHPMGDFTINLPKEKIPLPKNTVSKTSESLNTPKEIQAFVKKFLYEIEGEAPLLLKRNKNEIALAVNAIKTGDTEYFKKVASYNGDETLFPHIKHALIQAKVIDYKSTVKKGVFNNKYINSYFYKGEKIYDDENE